MCSRYISCRVEQSLLRFPDSSQWCEAKEQAFKSMGRFHDGRRASLVFPSSSSLATGCCSMAKQPRWEFQSSNYESSKLPIGFPTTTDFRKSEGCQLQNILKYQHIGGYRGDIWDISWGDLGEILGRSWEYLGRIRGISRGYQGDIWGISGVYLGNMRGISGECPTQCHKRATMKRLHSTAEKCSICTNQFQRKLQLAETLPRM